MLVVVFRAAQCERWIFWLRDLDNGSCAKVVVSEYADGIFRLSTGELLFFGLFSIDSMAVLIFCRIFFMHHLETAYPNKTCASQKVTLIGTRSAYTASLSDTSAAHCWRTGVYIYIFIPIISAI